MCQSNVPLFLFSLHRLIFPAGQMSPFLYSPALHLPYNLNKEIFSKLQTLVNLILLMYLKINIGSRFGWFVFKNKSVFRACDNNFEVLSL